MGSGGGFCEKDRGCGAAEAGVVLAQAENVEADLVGQRDLFDELGDAPSGGGRGVNVSGRR